MSETTGSVEVSEVKHSASERVRMVAYYALILIGLAFVAYGLIFEDMPTALAGIGIITGNVIALPNVPKSALKYGAK